MTHHPGRPFNGGSGASSSGAGDPDDEYDEFAPVVGEVPGPIFELAESCRRFVFSAIGIELDFEPETLPLLDEYARQAQSGVTDRPEALPLVTQAIAAYFGEVLRRRVDSFWRHRSDPSDEWRLCGRRVYVSMSPLGMVLESMARGAERAGPSAELDLAPEDARIAEARLESLPPVSEDEFYLLSTRVEVVETILETLREEMKREGRESLVFEESDYDED